MDEVWKIAARAREKLQTEADRPWHCLRRMVLTANMLDNIMERFFNHGQELSADDCEEQGLRLSNKVAGNLLKSGCQEDSDEDFSDEDCNSDSGSDCSNDTNDILITTPPKDNRMTILAKGELFLAEDNSFDNDACSDDTCSDDGCSDEVDIVELILTRCQTHSPGIEDKSATEVDVVQLITPLDSLDDRTEQCDNHHGAIVDTKVVHQQCLEIKTATEVNVVQLLPLQDSSIDNAERGTYRDNAILNAELSPVISKT